MIAGVDHGAVVLYCDRIGVCVPREFAVCCEVGEEVLEAEDAFLGVGGSSGAVEMNAGLEGGCDGCLSVDVGSCGTRLCREG